MQKILYIGILFIILFSGSTFLEAARLSRGQCVWIINNASSQSYQYKDCARSFPDLVSGSSGSSGSSSHSPSSSSSSSGHSSSPSNVIWLDTDVSGWPQTANLSAGISGNSIELNYDKANSWPAANIIGTSLVGNAWIVVPIDGKWYGGTWEWLRPGQTAKEKAAVYSPGHLTRSPMDSWLPRDGETYYFMVSTPARSGDRTINERSNLSAVTWSGGIEAGKTTEEYMEELREKTQKEMQVIADDFNENIDSAFEELGISASSTDTTDPYADGSFIQDVLPVEYTYYDEVYDLLGYLVIPDCYSYNTDVEKTSGNNFELQIEVEREDGEECTEMEVIEFEEEIEYDGNIDLKVFINETETDIELFDRTIYEEDDLDFNDEDYNEEDQDQKEEDDDNNQITTTSEDEVDINLIINLLIATGVIPENRIATLEATFNTTFIRPTNTTTSPSITQPTQSNPTTIQTTNTRPSSLLGSRNNNPTTFTGFNRDLTIGAQGADVQKLQQYLNNNGYTIATSGAGSPGNETSYFGPATQSALARFQEDNNISPASGYFGALSRELVD